MHTHMSGYMYKYIRMCYTYSRMCIHAFIHMVIEVNDIEVNDIEVNVLVKILQHYPHT